MQSLFEHAEAVDEATTSARSSKCRRCGRRFFYSGERFGNLLFFVSDSIIVSR
jgi:hypothetical protein